VADDRCDAPPSHCRTVIQQGAARAAPVALYRDAAIKTSDVPAINDDEVPTTTVIRRKTIKKSIQKNRCKTQQKNSNSQYHTTIKTQRPSATNCKYAASDIVVPSTETSQHSIRRQKNSDVAVSSGTTENRVTIQPSDIVPTPRPQRTPAKRWKHRKPAVKWKPPDITHVNATANPSSLPDEFQKN